MSESLISGEATEVSEKDISNDVPNDDANDNVDANVNESDEQELIFGKYKDMDAATEAFKHLESQIGKLKRERAPEAPEEYNIDFSEDNDLKDIVKDYDLNEDPLYQHMVNSFKEANITDEQARTLIKNKLLFDKEQMIDPVKEREKIGADFENMDREISTYLARNVSPETAEIVKSFGSTAEGFKAIHELISKPSSIPTKAETVTGEKSDDLYSKAQELRNNPNFLTNYEAQQKYNSLMEKAIALEEKGL